MRIPLEATLGLIDFFFFFKPFLSPQPFAAKILLSYLQQCFLILPLLFS